MKEKAEKRQVLGFSILNKSGEKLTMSKAFKRAILRLLFLLTIPLALTSCGSEQFAGGGIGGTGIYAGEITGFGSVWVNGVEFFETVQSSITVDDSPDLQEGDLKIGMYVTLGGSLNSDGVTGTYESIVYDDDIEGPITDDPAEDIVSMTKTFEIFGMTIIVEKNDTVFDDGTGSGFDYETIAKDDVVEVSGFINGGGALHATRIEKKGVLILGTTVVEVNGTVSGFDGTNTFNLGALTVNFDENGINTDLSEVSGSIIDGLYVEVEGNLVGIDSIFATRIEVEEEGLVLKTMRIGSVSRGSSASFKD